MNGLKTFLLVMLIILLFPAWIAIEGLVAVGSTFLNSRFYVSRFEEYNAYQYAPEFVAELIEDYTGDFPAGAGDFIVRAVDSGDLQEWMETEIARAIDGSRRFLFGFKPEPRLQVDMTPIKASIRENIPADAPEAMKSSFREYLKEIPDAINLIQNNEYSTAEQAVRTYRNFRIIPPIMLLTFVTLIFVMAGLRNGTIWIGSSLPAAGALPAIVLSIGLLAAESLEIFKPEVTGSYMSSAAFVNLEAMIADMITSFLRVIRNVCLVFALVGIGFMATGIVMNGFHRRDTSFDRRIDSM
ncbi:MAG: hypothetical protein ACLFST_12745 [Spirochaetia bacterium]